jgi:hypothetical protein
MITVLATAAALTIAIDASGFDFDLMVVVSIGFASAIAGMCVSDYSRTSRRNIDAVKTPAVAGKSARHSTKDVEFATFATYNTTIG